MADGDISRVDPAVEWGKVMDSEWLKRAMEEAGYDFPRLIHSPCRSDVTMIQGDITELEVDAIVNAANNGLRGGGGVDGAIHSAAGARDLHAACARVAPCPTGEARVTLGFRLPASHIIHTVGPIGENPYQLARCYISSLHAAKHIGARSIAFPCISTGVFGYPIPAAARVACATVRAWLEANPDALDKVIFCVFDYRNCVEYCRVFPTFFPKLKPAAVESTPEENPAEEDDDDEEEEEGGGGGKGDVRGGDET